MNKVAFINEDPALKKIAEKFVKMQMKVILKITFEQYAACPQSCDDAWWRTRKAQGKII